MQFLLNTLALAAAVSALPQPRSLAVRQEPRIMSPEEAAHEALVAVGMAKGAFNAAAAAKIIPVVVGGQQVTFVPNSVQAAVGDVIQFQFSNGNHTVTQSNEAEACQPLQKTLPGALHSGHIPFQDGQATVGTFNVPVVSEEPMFLYCATGPHCQLGQMMIVNPKTADQVVQYNKASNGAKANVDGTTVAGGTVAQIPLANAAFVPAPPKEDAKPPPAPPAEAPKDAPPAAPPAEAPKETKAGEPPAEAPKATPPPAEAPKETKAGEPPAEAPKATPPPAAANPAAPVVTLSGTTTVVVTVGAGQIPAPSA